jgi:hypothetical protein
MSSGGGAVTSRAVVPVLLDPPCRMAQHGSLGLGSANPGQASDTSGDHHCFSSHPAGL